MKPNFLWGYRAYLSGAIERQPQKKSINEKSWREEIAEFLQKRNILVIDPHDRQDILHTMDPRIEKLNKDDLQYLRDQRSMGHWETVRDISRAFRSLDLRLVDLADFIICYIDVNIHTCGTYEELFWANRCKKPVLVLSEEKTLIPFWLFGTLPQEHIFENLEELKRYIAAIDDGIWHDNTGRWTFIDYKKLYGQLVSQNGSKAEKCSKARQ